MKKILYIFVLFLLLVPAAIWIEQAYPYFWHERLLLNSLEYEPDLKDVFHEEGTFLPDKISEDLTLTPADNPVILKKTTVIAPNGRLAVESGTEIFAHEFAFFSVEGEIVLNGSADNIIHITTNHKHSAKHAWGGFVFQSGSRGRISYATLRYGSPAITCLSGSRVNIDHARLHMGEAGLFTESDDCNINDSIIHGVRHGIIATDAGFNFDGNRISGYRQDIFVPVVKHDKIR